MQMECVVTRAPGCYTLVRGVVNAVGFTFDTWLHQVVAANGTRVHHNVPGPEGHCCPFFDLKTGLFLRFRGHRQAGGLEVHGLHGVVLGLLVDFNLVAVHL